MEEQDITSSSSRRTNGAGNCTSRGGLICSGETSVKCQPCGLSINHIFGILLSFISGVSKQPEGLLSVYLRARLWRCDAELRRGTPLKVAVLAQQSVLGRVLYLNLHPAWMYDRQGVGYYLGAQKLCFYLRLPFFEDILIHIHTYSCNPIISAASQVLPWQPIIITLSIGPPASSLQFCTCSHVLHFFHFPMLCSSKKACSKRYEQKAPSAFGCLWGR